ncbi:hypothetical protein DK26_14935 [Bosea sp. WAO]|uniref:hypothetical protein n=1 Tax=Bosea sp. WAO TaxID=406341 RepID=UPI000747A979|nr:hypothetical protein [Bosea sp. WAO]KUL94309.1 hypothetical protein DK26_14935 [Bosea sp. WAO]
MALAFDTLGYAKALKAGGVKAADAEAMAEAARDFIMAEIATREDLRQALEVQTLRLTIRLGLMVAGGAGSILAAGFLAVRFLANLPH